MLETLAFVAFILAILFVAVMAPKPAGRNPKPPGGGPSAKEPPTNEPSAHEPSATGPDASGQEKHDPDPPGG
jgi:hypothetical protein